MARRLRRRLAVAETSLTSCDARRATRGGAAARRYGLSERETESIAYSPFTIIRAF